MRSRGDPKRITRPFLKEEQCESQFGVDDPVMFVIATGWREDGKHRRCVKEAHLSRTPANDADKRAELKLLAIGCCGASIPPCSESVCHTSPRVPLCSHLWFGRAHGSN